MEGEAKMNNDWPLVFICMPITPRSQEENHALEFLENLRNGVDTAVVLIKAKCCVYCPATDFVYWLRSDAITAEEIYQADLNLIPKCDALLMLKGVAESKNCMREIETANEHSLYISDDINELLAWREIKYGRK